MNKRISSPHAPPPNGALGVRRVLLIDSDQEALDRNTAHLLAAGHQVVATADPSRGWELAAATRLDVIVLDVRLRRGFDGLELMQRLRQHPGTALIPIVVLTSFVFPADDKLAMLAGCAAYLTKPCTPATLLNEITRVNPRSSASSSPTPRDRTSA